MTPSKKTEIIADLVTYLAENQKKVTRLFIAKLAKNKGVSAKILESLITDSNGGIYSVRDIYSDSRKGTKAVRVKLV